jgi:CO/xanthine dehydrogenase Mo-binding subunit
MASIHFTLNGRFAKAPSRRGFGMACTDYKGTYVATMAEVKVDKKSGAVRVQRVVCAQDTGEVINPESIGLQIEGRITMGLGYVLSEEIHFSHELSFFVMSWQDRIRYLELFIGNSRTWIKYYAEMFIFPRWNIKPK